MVTLARDKRHPRLGGHSGSFKVVPSLGPLTRGGGGPQCRLLILRNGNDPCCYSRNFHVDLQIAQRHLSNLRNTLYYFSVADRSFMLPVDFKNWPCHPDEFKGQGHLSLHLARPTLQLARSPGKAHGE